MEIPPDGRRLMSDAGQGALRRDGKALAAGRSARRHSRAYPRLCPARACESPFRPRRYLFILMDQAFAGSIAQLVLNFVPDPAAALAERLDRGGLCLPADVLGHGDGADPAAGDSTAAWRHWRPLTVCRNVCPAARRPAPVGHDLHGLRELIITGSPLWGRAGWHYVVQLAPIACTNHRRCAACLPERCT